MATLTVEAKCPAKSRPWSESVGNVMFRAFFTSVCGMTFSDWCETLRANRFAVSPQYWHRAALVTVGSVLNSWYQRREDRTFGDRIDRATSAPFIDVSSFPTEFATRPIPSPIAVIAGPSIP